MFKPFTNIIAVQTKCLQNINIGLDTFKLNIRVNYSSFRNHYMGHFCHIITMIGKELKFITKISLNYEELLEIYSKYCLNRTKVIVIRMSQKMVESTFLWYLYLIIIKFKSVEQKTKYIRTAFQAHGLRKYNSKQIIKLQNIRWPGLGCK